MSLTETKTCKNITNNRHVISLKTISILEMIYGELILKLVDPPGVALA